VGGPQYGLHPYARTREDAADANTSEASGEAAGKTGVAQPQDRRDTRTGRFLPGHRFWAARSSSGPPPKFADGAALWKACVAYFDWVHDHPLYEHRIVTYRGHSTQVPVRKMRPMSKGQLCAFLNIERSTWNGWRKNRPDLDTTIERVESVIWIWQFEGAAAGLLDEGMVIRQLGIGRKVNQ
jgi:hypothetical protein